MKIDDIRERKFEKSFSGYRTDEVEKFILQVSDEFSKLQGENKALENKLDILANKIREYREDEEAIKEALLGAQKQSQVVISQANQTAKSIIDEAIAERDKILNKLIEEKTTLELENKTINHENQVKAEKIISEAVTHAKTIQSQLESKIKFQENLLLSKKAEVNNFRNDLFETIKKIEKLLIEMPKMVFNESSIPNTSDNIAIIDNNTSIPESMPLNAKSDNAVFVQENKESVSQPNNDDMVFTTDNNDEIVTVN